MMKPSLSIVLVVAVWSATAESSVWDRAVTSPEEEAAKERYDAKMIEGDTAALMATIEGASVANTQASIKRAVAAYREAAALRPNDGEPYFRIGHLLHQMYFDCDPSSRVPTCDPMLATPAQQARTIEAWNEFEHRAPLDPRIGGILVKRAIHHTRLVNGSASDRGHLEAAARDYQTARDRQDGLTGTRGDEVLLGNMAETYMMLGRIDDAITTYLQAIAEGVATVSTIYGLAVALDRDGAGDQALRRIREQGPTGFDGFKTALTRGTIFYVPRGEEYYYLALSHEAFGHHGMALEYWKRFIASGAHPEFRPRAEQHIEQLKNHQAHADRPAPTMGDRTWRPRVR